MNLLLDEYADNPIIDEVVYWPPKCIQRIIVKQRPHGVEVVFDDGTEHFTSFENLNEDIFLKWLQEANEVLKLVTNIEVIGSVAEADGSISEKFVSKLLQRRSVLIDDCLSRYQGSENDEFTRNWFLEQFGFNCVELPRNVRGALHNAANT